MTWRKTGGFLNFFFDANPLLITGHIAVSIEACSDRSLGSLSHMHLLGPASCTGAGLTWKRTLGFRGPLDPEGPLSSMNILLLISSKKIYNGVTDLRHIEYLFWVQL